MNKRIFLKCSLLTCVFFCSYRLPTMEVGLTGHLRSKSHKRVSGFTVFVKGAIKNGLGSATTDKKGDFELGFDVSEDYSALSFYYVNEQKTPFC